jgi:hypothetical protein
VKPRRPWSFRGIPPHRAGAALGAYDTAEFRGIRRRKLYPAVDRRLVPLGGSAPGPLDTPAEAVTQQRPHTCAGSCCAPVRRWITTATRSRVHSSPTDPFAVAPSNSACSILTSWASDSRRAGPLGALLRRASVPPTLMLACQTLTAWAETSSWRATQPVARRR